MSELEVAQYAEYYINSMLTSARSYFAVYFLMGVLFTIVSLCVIHFIPNMIWNLIEAKRQKKESEDEK